MQLLNVGVLNGGNEQFETQPVTMLLESILTENYRSAVFVRVAAPRTKSSL